MTDTKRKYIKLSDRAKNWTVADFLKAYGSSYISMDIVADCLNNMDVSQFRQLSLVVNDMVRDIDRHKRRKIAEEQLFEGETLRNY